MKNKILFLIVFLSCFLLFFSGCDSVAKSETLCVKCGKTATSTFTGTSYVMQQNGISLSDCKQITDDVYSAYVCDSCIGIK